jgi:hypothetical protein
VHLIDRSGDDVDVAIVSRGDRATGEARYIMTSPKQGLRQPACRKTSMSADEYAHADMMLLDRRDQ